MKTLGFSVEKSSGNCLRNRQLLLTCCGAVIQFDHVATMGRLFGEEYSPSVVDKRTVNDFRAG